MKNLPPEVQQKLRQQRENFQRAHDRSHLNPFTVPTLDQGSKPQSAPVVDDKAPSQEPGQRALSEAGVFSDVEKKPEENKSEESNPPENPEPTSEPEHEDKAPEPEHEDKATEPEHEDKPEESQEETSKETEPEQTPAAEPSTDDAPSP